MVNSKNIKNYRYLMFAFILGCAHSSSDFDIGPDEFGKGGSSGSGSNEGIGLGFKNGSRLIAQEYVGSDGSRQFRGWYDLEMGTECAVMQAEDDVYRCLPKTDIIFQTYYTDSLCTKEAALTSCNSSAEYGLMSIMEGCNIRFKVLKVGPLVSDIYQKTGSGCSLIGMPQGSLVYSIESEVSPSKFVELSIE